MNILDFKLYWLSAGTVKNAPTRARLAVLIAGLQPIEVPERLKAVT